MILTAWARKWGVPLAAIQELQEAFGAMPRSTSSADGETESAMQAKIRLSASQKGIKLFRNNVGAGKLENGSFVRWGLCNDSAALNKEVKSSDLIGIRPMLVTQEHVGLLIGQFIAREVKNVGWVYQNTPREQAQLRFLQWVSAHGGDARFTNSPQGDL